MTDSKTRAVAGTAALVSLASILSLSLSACVRNTEPGASPSDANTNASNTATTAASPGNPFIIGANSVSPGNYKTVLKDGVEYKQGRFGEGKPGGNLIKSIVASDPKTLNYWAANDSTSRELASNMFSGLLSIDPYTGEVIPDLAESFTASPDGRTYTTRLRKGLKWSDGHPITAEDVAYTWNTIVKEGLGNSSLRDITTVDGVPTKVEVIDELTNRFTTAKPFVPFSRVLGLPPAPKHVIEPIVKGKDGRKAFDGLWSMNAKPESFVTSGPYRFESYVPSQRVVLKRSNTYYGISAKGAPLPYLAQLTYIIVPKVDANLLKFKGGEIDITPVRPRDAGDLVQEASKGNFKLYDFGPSQGSSFIMFNLNRRANPKTKKPYVDPIKSAWFNDLNFRQAINHAVDRQAIISNYFKGLGEVSVSPFLKSSPFYNTELKPFDQDLEMSRKLLADSGFKLDAQKQLVDKDGHRVEFNLFAPAGGTFAGFVCNGFRDELKKLGIKVNYQELNFNLLGDKISNSLDWDACFFSLTGGDPLEPNDSSNVYKSNGRLHLFDQRLADTKGDIITSDARDWEKRIDQVMNQGALEFDKAKRRALYSEMQQILYDQVPMILVPTPKVIVAARNTLQNYSPSPLSQESMGLHNLDELYKQEK
ncbi:MAG: ABC transporter substrate-binding protein [Candidatus Obscuribacterales bacterium]|nr:ABC transporter substrate-binding protein [Candidatus Obscuribacterales bacterium]